jgi:MFS family permease
MSNLPASPQPGPAAPPQPAAIPAAVPEQRRFSPTYWMCNIIEMWERLAYYVLRPVAPIYIMQATEPGGLHLTAGAKGTIYAWWAIFQSLLPMVTGGYADRYGYKRTLFFAVTMNICGYVMMAFLHSYWGFFGGIIVLATGTAFFKPALQGTLAHTLNKASASMGWGIFYWIVNVGSLVGHYLSPLLLGASHGAAGWRTLFLACACFTALNYLMLLRFRDVPSGACKTENPLQVLRRTLVNVFEPRLITWLLIMSCFWLMMYQLWDTQPNFIEDWVSSAALAHYMPFDSWREVGDQGLLRVPQQVLISLNALLIVVFIVPVSWLVRRMRTLSAMFFGMVMATAGLLVAGLTPYGAILLVGIALFSLGEMLTGPKKSEYLALIAPPAKKGLYLGYVNIPVGIGVAAGNWIAGYVYGHYGEKATLALKYLVTQTSFGAGKTWDGAVSTLEAAAGIPRTAAFATLQDVLNINGQEATALLWQTYHPQYVWLPFAAIGVVAAIALAIFGQMAKRWRDMNA